MQEMIARCEAMRGFYVRDFGDVRIMVRIRVSYNPV